MNEGKTKGMEEGLEGRGRLEGLRKDWRNGGKT